MYLLSKQGPRCKYLCMVNCVVARTEWCGQTRQSVRQTTYRRRYSSHRVAADCTAVNVTGGLSVYFSMRCLSVGINLLYL